MIRVRDRINVNDMVNVRIRNIIINDNSRSINDNYRTINLDGIARVISRTPNTRDAMAIIRLEFDPPIPINLDISAQFFSGTIIRFDPTTAFSPAPAPSSVPAIAPLSAPAPLPAPAPFSQTPVISREDLDADLKYLFGLGLNPNSGNEVMNDRLAKWRELTGEDYVYVSPTTEGGTTGNSFRGGKRKTMRKRRSGKSKTSKKLRKTETMKKRNCSKYKTRKN
jgi:hypothetical protein